MKRRYLRLMGRHVSFKREKTGGDAGPTRQPVQSSGTGVPAGLPQNPSLTLPALVRRSRFRLLNYAFFA